jgi:hypothetical protein
MSGDSAARAREWRPRDNRRTSPAIRHDFSSCHEFSPPQTARSPCGPYLRAVPLHRRGRVLQIAAMQETSLYPAVKRFLAASGFHVKGEVHGCDAVAVRDGEPLRLAIVEMKLGFNLDLLLQAVERLRIADEVWLAVPATRRGRDRDPRVQRLCRLIGLGLMAVHVASDRVEILVEPGPYRPRPNPRRRARLLSEHARRAGDPSPGGSSRQPIMTAYRQQALACAALLQDGPSRPRDLRVVAPAAGRILLNNVYGWFERAERGVYRLTADGEAALRRWPAFAAAPRANAGASCAVMTSSDAVEMTP